MQCRERLVAVPETERAELRVDQPFRGSRASLLLVALVRVNFTLPSGAEYAAVRRDLLHFGRAGADVRELHRLRQRGLERGQPTSSRSRRKYLRSSDLGAPAAAMSFWLPHPRMGHCADGRSEARHARASCAPRRRAPSARPGTPRCGSRSSRPHTARPACRTPSSTTPSAFSGSSTPRTGSIHPPHSGWPIGGVTSQANVARWRGGINRYSSWMEVNRIMPSLHAVVFNRRWHSLPLGTRRVEGK